MAGGDGDGRLFPADATTARSLGLEIKLFAVSNNGDGFREGAGDVLGIHLVGLFSILGRNSEALPHVLERQLRN